jgi:hypothetical protein
MSVFRSKCPHCDGEIVLNERRRVASHSAPECKWFSDLNDALLGRHQVFAEVLDDHGEPISGKGEIDQ